MKSILLSMGLLGCALAQSNQLNGADKVNQAIPNLSPNLMTQSELARSSMFMNKICPSNFTVEKIVNGDFGDNKCGGNNVCIWDQSNYQNYVNGWSVSPSTEIGYAFIYNSEITPNNKRVIELDAYTNTCFKQSVTLTPGSYVLKYEWAARNGVELNSCKMGVYINNQLMKAHTPIDYHLQQ